MTYYTTFVSGFDTLVADALARALGDARVLSVMDGHSVKDVATLAGIAEGTVKSRLFKARARLKEALR